MLPRKLRLGFVVLVAAALASADAQSVSYSPTQAEIAVYARLLSMGDARQLDMPLVERALGSRWSALRDAATMSIGQVGAQPTNVGSSRLVSLIADPNTTVA